MTNLTSFVSTIFRNMTASTFRRALAVAFALTVLAIPMAQEVYAIPKPPNPILVLNRYRPTVHTTTSQSFVGASMTSSACQAELLDMVPWVQSNGHTVTWSGCVNDRWATQ